MNHELVFAILSVLESTNDQRDRALVEKERHIQSSSQAASFAVPGYRRFGIDRCRLTDTVGPSVSPGANHEIHTTAVFVGDWRSP